MRMEQQYTYIGILLLHPHFTHTTNDNLDPVSNWNAHQKKTEKANIQPEKAQKLSWVEKHRRNPIQLL